MIIQDLFVQGKVPDSGEKKKVIVYLSTHNLERLQAISEIIFQKTGRKVSKSQLAVMATDNFLREAIQYLTDLGIKIPQ